MSLRQLVRSQRIFLDTRGRYFSYYTVFRSWSWWTMITFPLPNTRISPLNDNYQNGCNRWRLFLVCQIHYFFFGGGGNMSVSQQLKPSTKFRELFNNTNQKTDVFYRHEVNMERTVAAAILLPFHHYHLGSALHREHDRQQVVN